MIVSLVNSLALLLLFKSSPTSGFSLTKNVRHQQSPQQLLQSFRLHSIPTPIDTALSGLASICRLPRGVTVDEDCITKANDADNSNNDSSTRHNTTIVLQELYNIENDVACRKVRERLTELNLCVQKVIAASPKSRVMSVSPLQFSVPQLVVQVQQQQPGDESSQQVVYLSGVQDILDYLNTNFGGGGDKKQQQQDGDTNNVMAPLLDLWNVVGNYLATMLRLGRGMDRVLAAGALNQVDDTSLLPMAPGRPQQQALILYDYEGNQFCRLVREVLHELDLVYELRTVGKGSPRRLGEMAGWTVHNSTTCPFLMDPNTNVRMQDSADIIAYLYQTYALWTPPNEQLQWISNKVLPLFQPFFAWQAKLPSIAGNDNNDDDTTDKAASQKVLTGAKAEIQSAIAAHPICIYTYEWSPFSSQAKALLDNLADGGVSYHEISLGREWLPGLITSPSIRAALLDLTGQSSLPHVFIGGKSIGGLFSGTPGLVPALEQGILRDLIDQAMGAAGRRRQQDRPNAAIPARAAAVTSTTPSSSPMLIRTMPPPSPSRVVIEETGDFQ